jgi:hypothetical protein
MRQILLLACLTLPLAGCDTPSIKASETEAEETKLTLEFKAISGSEVFATVIPAETAANDLVLAARKKCDEKESCQVFAWKSAANPARALPMTDREVDTMAFRYAFSRSTGYENSNWDCKIWPREDKAECI